MRKFAKRIYAGLPSEAQYVVPFAHKIRWYMKMNLREAVHMCDHHAAGPSRLPLHLPGDVAEDPGSASRIGRSGKIHRLAEVPFGAACKSEMWTEFKKSAIENKK